MVYLYIHLALQILFIMTYPALVKFLVVIRVRMFAIYLFVAKLLRCIKKKKQNFCIFAKTSMIYKN